MKFSFREALATSHIAEVAVIVLLLRGIRAALLPLNPSSAQTIFSENYRSLFSRLTIFETCYSLVLAFIFLGAAFSLAHWTHGVGPLPCLRRLRQKLKETVSA
jgi:hypothetical protein